MAAEAIDPLHGIAETEQITGKSRSWISRKQGDRFPAPLMVGERRFWRASVLRAWLESEQTRPRRRPVQLRHVAEDPKP